MSSPRFQTTRWSLVAAATGPVEGPTRAALEELVEGYWTPLYAFARRQGATPEDAEDLVQGFLAALLEKDYVGDADPERGRFRTFLLAAFRNFTSKERAKAGAQKRGGDRTFVSLDRDAGERRFEAVSRREEDPERAFYRVWAHEVLDRAWARVAARYRDRSPEQQERFEALRPVIAGGQRTPYADIGLRLGLSETAVKVAAHRLRTRFRDALRAEIGETLEGAEDVDGEIRFLMGVLRGTIPGCPATESS